MPSQPILDAVARYYAGKLQSHGRTAAGVDWRDEASQFLRFDQLLRVIQEPDASVADIGCGLGALLGYLRKRGHTGRYEGTDIAPEMIAAAIAEYGADGQAQFTIGSTPAAVADYAVASGIFNVRLHHDEATWRKYITDTLATMDRCSIKGFSFNCLTSYSDAERMRPDLYYGDPSFYFDLCKCSYSRQVALLHDYGLYEFTIVVRKP